jgi:hypothetical protein
MSDGSTVRVVYVGPHDDDPVTGVAVEVPIPDSDAVISASKGVPIEVAHEIAYGSRVVHQLAATDANDDPVFIEHVVERAGLLAHGRDDWQLVAEPDPPQQPKRQRASRGEE